MSNQMEPEAGLVDNLVTQFSSAFDCFRELVQNSLDAGSPTIDVWTEFEAGNDHVGTIRLVVEDYGSGMDERIIDQELTQLFASSKEHDLTKIGKFGIGFVSVFALKPEAVLVHTGRAGDWWEVLFHKDRSFTKTRLDVPVEGTSVTLFLEGDYHRYRELSDSVLASLRRWCVHAHTPITFEDRSPPRGGVPEMIQVDRQLDLDAECVVSRNFPGMLILAGYELDPSYSFYNRGLTLTDTRVGEDVWPPDLAVRLQHVSVKVNSNYLEHTLSRDTVMRDEHWRRTVNAVRRLVDENLSQRLLDEIEKLALADRWDMATMHRYARLTRYLAWEPDDVIQDIVVRKVFRDVNGSVWSPEEVWEAYRRDGRVLIADTPSELSRRLGKMGIPVILGKWRRGMDAADRIIASSTAHPLESVPLMVSRCVALRSRTTFWGTIKRLFGVNIAGRVESAIADPQLVYLPVAVDEQVPAPVQRLLEHASALLDAVGAGYRGLSTFVPSSTSREVPFFVTGREFGEVMARPPRGFEQRSYAAINRVHPHFERLATSYQARPPLAAYCLAKSLLLTEDRLLNRDLDLIRAARDGGLT